MCKWCLFWISWLLLTAGYWTAAQAEEPAQQFLDALHENGYHDIAIRYLELVEQSDLISDEFRKVIPFEKAEALIKNASRLRDVDELEQQLDEAERLLSQYVTADLEPELEAKTNRYRGNLRMSRARLYLRRVESDRLTEVEKSQWQNKAREMLLLALRDYSSARESLRNAINTFQVDVSDPNTTERLRQLRSTYTQIRLKLPVVKEQLADTYAEPAPERKKLLTEAAAEYAELYDKYYRFAAGLDSSLFAARCYQKLGLHEDALNMLKELFQLENTGALKTLKRKAVALATDSWGAVSPYPADDVISQCAPLVNALTRQELRQPDWLKVQLELAKAYRHKAEEIKQAGGSGSAGKTQDLNRQAAKLIRNVSRTPSDLRDDANKLMTQWNLSVRDVEELEQPPESFADARQQGQDLVVDVESLLREAAQIKSKIVAATTEAERSGLQSELEATQTDIRQQAEQALRLFDVALSLADDQIQREDINKLRYLQSVCHYAMENYFESALIGKFLLDRYPSVDWTQQAAALIVRSYSALYDQKTEAEQEFAKIRLQEVCQRIIDRWPGSNQAGTAATTMTKLALEQQDYESAAKYYAMIPSTSPARTALGLRVGQKMWFAYLKAKSSGDSEVAQQRLGQARNFLETAVSNSDPSAVTYDAALGALLLVDAHLVSGEVEKALARLESEPIAPLDLIKQKHPVITGNARESLFKREAYKTAVKLYLAAMRNDPSPQQWINKALGVVSAMRDDPENAEKMDSVYRLIAKSLMDQFDQLQSSQDQEKFGQSLASFLSAIEQNSQDAKTILWAGRTLMQVADSLAAQSMDATELYEQAVSALVRAESVGFSDEPNADRLTEELKRQKALAQRGSGNFQAALDQLGEILVARINNRQKSLVDVQIDAAETIHLWARSTTSADKYALATAGTLKTRDPRTKREANAIWGWKKLAQATAGKPAFAELHAKCMFHLIDARYQYGQIKNNDRAIASARKELANLANRDPELGGPTWKPKFEQLKKQIN